MTVLLLHTSCICIVRIACIWDLAFVEETIGEALTRGLTLIISALGAVGSVFIIWLFDETLPGSTAAILTGKDHSPGNIILQNYSS